MKIAWSPVNEKENQHRHRWFKYGQSQCSTYSRYLGVMTELHTDKWLIYFPQCNHCMNDIAGFFSRNIFILIAFY